MEDQVRQNKEAPDFKRNVQVFRFIGGNLVSFFGDQIYFIALPLIILAITNSPLSMGIAAAVEKLAVLLQPLAGELADRLSRKWLLLFCDFGRFIVMGVMGFLHIIGNLTLWEIYTGAFVFGVLTQIYNTCQFASIPALVQEKDLQLANSINSGIFQTAVFIGPGVGGLLISLFNPGVGLILNSLTFLFGFVMVLSLRLESQVRLKEKEGRSILDGIQEGFQFVLTQKPILVTNLAMLISVFGTTLFLTMLVVHLKAAAELTAIQIGWVLSIGGAASIIGSLSTSKLKKHFSYRKILFTAGFTGGLSIVLFGMSEHLLTLAVMNAVGQLRHQS
ncbi:MFS transporter [Halobacillus salinarum]|uniref:MFS transporter n=1 Tax=Halobacillus salinarum TaxID=2932257 RepID=A0ABY4EL87_9BACI|nr:MFS transporter [Halobacillus salinarum]UOQ42851.1 MFS transporter [Halobacillus salinarum]